MQPKNTIIYSYRIKSINLSAQDGPGKWRVCMGECLRRCLRQAVAEIVYMA